MEMLPEITIRLREIEARANDGEYRCREHFGAFDADADVLFLLAHIALLHSQQRDRTRAATRHWAVTVERNGENVVTIESNSLAGRDINPEDAEVIERAALHLLSFVGKSAALAAPPEGWQDTAGDLLAYGEQEKESSRVAKDREQHQFWCGWVEALQRVKAISANLPSPREQAWQPIVVDRDADLRCELRTYLDTLVITGDNIGEIRRSLFMPWDSPWNGWVRDETAERELPPLAASRSGETEP